MKRSKSLMLTSMMAGSSLVVSACGSPATQWSDSAPAAQAAAPEAQAVEYASLSECRASGQSAAACDQAYAAAQSDAAQNAPRFGDRQTCEEQYGVDRCVPRNEGGSSFFTPLLAGFLLGNLLNGGFGGRGYYRDRFGRETYGGGRPLNRDYVTGRPRIGADAFGAPARVQAPTRVQSRSSVISRGGFGGGGGRGYGG